MRDSSISLREWVTLPDGSTAQIVVGMWQDRRESYRAAYLTDGQGDTVLTDARDVSDEQLMQLGLDEAARELGAVLCE